MYSPTTPSAGPDSSSNVGSWTLFLNILVFFFNLFINFYLYRKRLIDEREYKSESEFYKTIVIDNLNNLITYPNNVEKQLIEIKKRWAKAHLNNENVRKVIEEGCDEIEKINETFIRVGLSSILCYSIELKNELEGIATNFHDGSTRKLSQLNRVNTNDKYSVNFFIYFGDVKVEYLKNLNALIRKHRPQIDRKKSFPWIFI